MSGNKKISPFVWRELVQKVLEGSVIPVIGPGLIRVTPNSDDYARWERPKDEKDLSIEGFHTLKLADEWYESGEKPAVHPRELPVDPEFNDFASLFLNREGTLNQLGQMYPSIKESDDQTEFVTEDPQPGEGKICDTLDKLASIPGFDIFLTTCGDSLLERALRSSVISKPVAPALAFSGKCPVDIPEEILSGQKRGVYHLMGKFSAEEGSFVFTEGDLLDFLLNLQSKCPPNLKSILTDRHLLVLGGRLDVWLSRFFLGIIKPNLMVDGQGFLTCRGSVGNAEKHLSTFLERYSPRTKLVETDCREFVRELAERIKAQTSGSVGATGANAASNAEVMPGALPQRAAFISYSSHNRSAAIQLKEKLEEKGIVAWFDKDQIKEGDNWEQKIRRNVMKCSVFLPIISHETETLLDSYFREEWQQAVLNRCGRQFGSNMRFVLPLVASHDLRRGAIRTVPEQFKISQSAQCSPDESIPQSYIDEVAEAVREWQDYDERKARLEARKQST